MQLMFIIWKWRALEGMDYPVDQYAIKGASGKVVWRINIENDEQGIKLLEELISKEGNDNEVLLFLHHRNGFTKKDCQYLDQRLEEGECII